MIHSGRGFLDSTRKERADMWDGRAHCDPFMSTTIVTENGNANNGDNQHSSDDSAH